MALCMKYWYHQQSDALMKKLSLFYGRNMKHVVICIRNSRGPNIEPGDTPNSILESSDCLFLTVVNCCLFVK